MQDANDPANPFLQITHILSKEPSQVHKSIRTNQVIYTKEHCIKLITFNNNFKIFMLLFSAKP